MWYGFQIWAWLGNNNYLNFNSFNDSKTAFNKLKWKRLKDIITLAKNWVEVAKSVIIWYFAVQEEERINEELMKHENQVVGLDPKTTKLVKDLIK